MKNQKKRQLFLPKRKLSLFRCTADFFICHKFLNKKKTKKVLIFWVKMSTIHLALREKEC